MIQINNQHDKRPGLLQLRDHLEELLVLIRLAKEVQAFKSFKAYTHVVELTAKVCSSVGWVTANRNPTQHG